MVVSPANCQVCLSALKTRWIQDLVDCTVCWMVPEEDRVDLKR